MKKLTIRYLYRLGSALMRRYTQAIDSIADGDTKFAEQACPMLKRYRRRAKACVRIIRRLRAGQSEAKE